MALEYSDVLQTVAEVAVTLAGFVGVIIVLRSGQVRQDGSRVLAHLLLGSLGVSGMALLPLIAQAAFADPTDVWRSFVWIVGLLDAGGAWNGTVDVLAGRLTMSRWLIALLPAAPA